MSFKDKIQNVPLVIVERAKFYKLMAVVQLGLFFTNENFVYSYLEENTVQYSTKE